MKLLKYSNGITAEIHKKNKPNEIFKEIAKTISKGITAEIPTNKMTKGVSKEFPEIFSNMFSQNFPKRLAISFQKHYLRNSQSNFRGFFTGTTKSTPNKKKKKNADNFFKCIPEENTVRIPKYNCLPYFQRNASS